jgi:tRNA threonylcarbamoyladenosine biosynthesis protein TsaB
MATILNLETSTTVCSASISKNGETIALRESFEDKSHASSLTVYIEELMEETGMAIADIDAVAVSQGPGSYTGLRIGVSAAKGICYASGKPLIAINTLQAMALMAKKEIPEKEAFLCPMIDARRMEVYSQVFDIETIEKRETKAEIIEENIYTEWTQNAPVYFFGNGSDKCKSVLSNENNVHFIDNIYPSAKFMGILAEQAFTNNQFVDVAYFEPFYLKDFVATTPKKKVL